MCVFTLSGNYTHYDALMIQTCVPLLALLVMLALYVFAPKLKKAPCRHIRDQKKTRNLCLLGTVVLMTFAYPGLCRFLFLFLGLALFFAFPSVSGLSCFPYHNRNVPGLAANPPVRQDGWCLLSGKRLLSNVRTTLVRGDRRVLSNWLIN